MAELRPPDEVAIVAVTGVLRGYRDDAREMLPDVLDGSAPALHRFRISIRRARSVVAASRGVLPDEQRDAAQRSLRAIARLTSPVRDLDVFVAALPELAAGDMPGGLAIEATAPEDDAPGDGVLGDDAPGDEALTALVELAVAAREQPSQRLEWALRGPDGAKLFDSWDGVSNAVQAGGGAPGPLATESALELVDEWTMASFRRTRKRGRAALESDDLEHWHDLRKSLKKLRYLVSAFKYLHRGKELKAVRKHLKGLQDHIGLLQDFRVQGDLAAQMGAAAQEAGMPAAADLAAQIEERIARAALEATQASCTDAWVDFDTPATKASFKALTKSRP